MYGLNPSSLQVITVISECAAGEAYALRPVHSSDDARQLNVAVGRNKRYTTTRDSYLQRTTIEWYTSAGNYARNFLTVLGPADGDSFHGQGRTHLTISLT